MIIRVAVVVNSYIKSLILFISAIVSLFVVLCLWTIFVYRLVADLQIGSTQLLLIFSTLISMPIFVLANKIIQIRQSNSSWWQEHIKQSSIIYIFLVILFFKFPLSATAQLEGSDIALLIFAYLLILSASINIFYSYLKYNA